MTADAPPKLRLVGHKGADLIAPGNTVASFEAAVAAGVDTIELDVLWLPDSHLPLEQRAPLVVAHDWEDAESRTPLTLTEALDAFLEPPLDRVEIDLDIKLPGREEEIVDGPARARPGRAGDDLDDGDVHPGADAPAGAGAAPRLDLSQGDQGLDLEAVGEAGASLRPGRDAVPASRLGGAEAAEFDVQAMWVYHPLVSPRLGRICELAGVELIAWTVDDRARMRKLLAAGVTGICSNDPRLFSGLDA